MQSGLRVDEQPELRRMGAESKLGALRVVAAAREPAGTGMAYSTGNTHLLSAILTKVTGTSTWQFAQDSLAKPLGFSLSRWPQDPQGIYFGGNDMLMTPRQMLAFGELYRSHGMINGRQIVPAAWVETSLVPRTRSNFSEQLTAMAGGCARWPASRRFMRGVSGPVHHRDPEDRNGCRVHLRGDGRRRSPFTSADRGRFDRAPGHRAASAAARDSEGPQ